MLAILAKVEKQEPIIWEPIDIRVEPSQVGAVWLMRQAAQAILVRENKCEIIERESPEEAEANLAMKLREAKVL